MKDSIEVRIGRYLANEMGEQERAEFQQALASDAALQEAYAVYMAIWNAKLVMPAEEWDTASAWKTFEHRNVEAPVVSSGRRILLYVAIAASVLILMGTFWFSFLAPSAITYQYSDADPVIELKDGSSIHLNKGSAVTVHPFDRKSRHVELSGEAYFEIATDPKRPFTVLCGQTVTEVVGTSFNLKQVLENVRLYVLSGKVIFRSATDQEKALALTAGEAATFDQQQMKLIPNPSPNASSWHTRQLQFKSIPLIDAVQDVSAYFGQSITIENADIHSCKVSMPLPYKEPDIESVLTAISRTVGATFIRDGEKCIIKGGTCQ